MTLAKKQAKILEELYYDGPYLELVSEKYTGKDGDTRTRWIKVIRIDDAVRFLREMYNYHITAEPTYSVDVLKQWEGKAKRTDRKKLYNVDIQAGTHDDAIVELLNLLLPAILNKERENQNNETQI